jgi:hypothetical protein
MTDTTRLLITIAMLIAAALIVALIERLFGIGEP